MGVHPSTGNKTEPQVTSVLKFPFIDFYTEVIQLTSALYCGHLNHACLQAWDLSKMLLVLKENGPLEKAN